MPLPSNVRGQLAENDFRISLVKGLGVAITALISLSQLSSDNRFSSSGPTWLDPASLTALIITGVTLGFFYSNTTYVSTLLRNRIADGNLQLTGTTFPQEVLKPRIAARWQFIAGLAGMVMTVGFFVAFLWT
jgi:hypothetical protein